MQPIETTRPITATPEARDAIARLRAEHGDLILHVTGGCCDARTPMCLKASDLSIGPRDVLLGHVEGIAVYEMQSKPEVSCFAGAHVLDLAPGMPVGFSIVPGDGLRFTLRDIVPSQAA